jgi:hypothetical protein
VNEVAFVATFVTDISHVRKFAPQVAERKLTIT